MRACHRYLLLTFTLGALFSCSDKAIQEKAEVIRPVKLLEVNLVRKKAFIFPGEVRASEQAILAFRVPGEILKYHVNSGQNVVKGQLLIELDKSDYELRVQTQRASYDLAKVQHERSASLVKGYLISQEDFDLSKTTLQIAESDYHTSLANLSYTKIYAPYDGVVANTYKNNFEFTKIQEPIMSMQSDDAIDVVIAIPERLMSPFKRLASANSPAKLSVSFPVSGKQTFDASFKSIATVADPDSGSYKIELTLPKPENINLLSGMSSIVNCELSLDANDIVTSISASSIMYENEQTFVWKYEPTTQTVVKTLVTLTETNELISGLNDRDFIVTSGVHELRDGQPVKQWFKERGL